MAKKKRTRADAAKSRLIRFCFASGICEQDGKGGVKGMTKKNKQMLIDGMTGNTHARAALKGSEKAKARYKMAKKGDAPMSSRKRVSSAKKRLAAARGQWTRLEKKHHAVTIKRDAPEKERAAKMKSLRDEMDKVYAKEERLESMSKRHSRRAMLDYASPSTSKDKYSGMWQKAGYSKKKRLAKFLKQSKSK